MHNDISEVQSKRARNISIEVGFVPEYHFYVRYVPKIQSVTLLVPNLLRKLIQCYCSSLTLLLWLDRINKERFS